MKTRYAKRPGCVPDLKAAMKINMTPTHFQRNPVEVELDDASVVKSGHLYADGRRFNFKQVYGEPIGNNWEYAHVTQLSYLDDEGNTQVVEVEPRNPHTLSKIGETRFGYVTKINSKRWGVLVKMNLQTGDAQIIADEGSPVVGALIQLI